MYSVSILRFRSPAELVSVAVAQVCEQVRQSPVWLQVFKVFNSFAEHKII